MYSKKGFVPLLVLVALAVSTSLLGIGAGSLVKKQILVSNPKAADGPGGNCDVGVNNGCGGENGCREWEWCKTDTGTCEWRDEFKTGYEQCGEKALVGAPSPSPIASSDDNCDEDWYCLGECANDTARGAMGQDSSLWKRLKVEYTNAKHSKNYQSCDDEVDPAILTPSPSPTVIVNSTYKPTPTPDPNCTSTSDILRAKCVPTAAPTVSLTPAATPLPKGMKKVEVFGMDLGTCIDEGSKLPGKCCGSLQRNDNNSCTSSENLTAQEAARVAAQVGAAVAAVQKAKALNCPDGQEVRIKRGLAGTISECVPAVPTPTNVVGGTTNNNLTCPNGMVVAYDGSSQRCVTPPDTPPVLPSSSVSRQGANRIPHSTPSQSLPTSALQGTPNPPSNNQQSTQGQNINRNSISNEKNTKPGDRKELDQEKITEQKKQEEIIKQKAKSKEEDEANTSNKRKLEDQKKQGEIKKEEEINKQKEKSKEKKEEVKEKKEEVKKSFTKKVSDAIKKIVKKPQPPTRFKQVQAE